MPPLSVGKLPHELLRRQLAKIKIDDPRVLVASRIGEDCAVVKTNVRCLVASTDPLA